MICKKCGAKLSNSLKFCTKCGNKIFHEEEREIDGTIIEVLEEDSIPIENRLYSDKMKKGGKDIALLITRLTLALIILIFVISMFMNWFSFGGTATELGFVEITDDMAVDKYLDENKEGDDNYIDLYVKMSPVKLIQYSIRYRDEYKNVYNARGEEKVSIFSWLHMILIWMLSILMVLAILSIIFLILGKGFKFIYFVKITSFIGVGIIILNFFALKITYFNMFAINAESVLQKLNPINAVRMTKEGIAMNNRFYPYYVKVNQSFIIALIALSAWVFISAILGEIRNRQEEKVDGAE